ncbi:hypothetical protein ACFLZS_00270 [Patescibacteria group bacterium]
MARINAKRRVKERRKRQRREREKEAERTRRLATVQTKTDIVEEAEVVVSSTTATAISTPKGPPAKLVLAFVVITGFSTAAALIVLYLTGTFTFTLPF